SARQADRRERPSGLLNLCHPSHSTATGPVTTIVPAVVAAIITAIGPVVASIIAAPLVALVAGAVVVPLAITRRHEVAVAIAIDHDRLGVADRALIVAALVYVHRHRAPVTRGLLP